jgi:aryl-alcohol dehydrogenase-like predicted oxidoreductase
MMCSPPCRHGVRMVAYAPLGRGFLVSAITGPAGFKRLDVTCGSRAGFERKPTMTTVENLARLSLSIA